MINDSKAEAPFSGETTHSTARKLLPIVFVTATLLNKTAKLLASFAAERDSEGVVYWFGFECGSQSIITTLVVPNADTTFGCISTSPEANAEAVSAIVGTPLVLIGQAHSHPAHKVRHSRVDDRDTFARFEGSISVVVPYFGRRGINLGRCGVHRHIDGKFRVIGRAQLDQHIIVLPGEADFRKKVYEENAVRGE
jgi:hypothetical protein